MFLWLSGYPCIFRGIYHLLLLVLFANGNTQLLIDGQPIGTERNKSNEAATKRRLLKSICQKTLVLPINQEK